MCAGDKIAALQTIFKAVRLALTIFGGCAVGWFLWLVFQIRPRRPAEAGFPYVYVNDDGSARELTLSEQEYLNTKFYGADGGRPYIKLHYGSRTPNGWLRGFLKRRRLPPKIFIDPAPHEITPLQR